MAGGGGEPAHLKAMVPAVTFRRRRISFMPAACGTCRGSNGFGAILLPDIEPNEISRDRKLPKKPAPSGDPASPKMLYTVPLDQLEELRGIAPYYYDWLKHPYDDPWWDWCDLRNKYGRVHAAVLNFSGGMTTTMAPKALRPTLPDCSGHGLPLPILRPTC